MAKPKVDPLKAKQKKQKMIAIGGAVLLLALMAFQVPRVMKQLNKKPPVSSAVTSTTAAPAAGTPPLAAPTLRGAEQSPTPGLAASDTSSGAVTSGDGAPVAQPGQLASFSRFASKDPFAQQMSTTGSPPAPSGGGSSSGGSSPGLSPSGGGSAPSSGSGASSAPAPGSVVLSVNGTLISVTVGTDFPQASASDPTLQPVFHLVSATLHTARIAIAGGSYSNGAATVLLRENKALTLMNTADGTRYRLILEPQGTAVSSTTTPSSSMPAAPATSTTSP